MGRGVLAKNKKQKQLTLNRILFCQNIVVTVTGLLFYLKSWDSGKDSSSMFQRNFCSHNKV